MFTFLKFEKMNGFGYQLTGTILVVVIATCFTSVTAFTDDSCSSKVIGQKENACFAHYNLTEAFMFGLPQPAHLTLFTHSMYNLCRNIVNLTSCLEDAMTTCGDPYFDFSSYSNTINKICNHRNLFYAAEAHCEMIDTLQTCIGQYNTDIQNLKYHIYLNRSEIPLSDMCT
ncbi:uncharacterized protein LOC132743575, partial [Ruditapes philippinarum]|uniref:uncharacterized protein LOC132743575 n=1 Tax=Ruditapes philippinarum TaxID=129788 RepID=UPI00295A8357